MTFMYPLWRGMSRVHISPIPNSIKHEDTSFKMCCTTHVMLLKNKQEHKILLKEFIQGRNISIHRRQDRSNSKD